MLIGRRDVRGTIAESRMWGESSAEAANHTLQGEALE
jgi:hypothetical protein